MLLPSSFVYPYINQSFTLMLLLLLRPHFYSRLATKITILFSLTFFCLCIHRFVKKLKQKYTYKPFLPTNKYEKMELTLWNKCTKLIIDHYFFCYIECRTRKDSY